MFLGAGALTGIGYIKGSECLSDFGCLAAQELGGGPPEPDRLKPSDFWVWRRGLAQRRRDWYREHLRPLLQQMSDVFGELAGRFEVLEVPASDGEDAAEAVQDLRVTAKLLALRCRQVLALYDAAAEVTEPRHRLEDARDALAEALDMVLEREVCYSLTSNASWRMTQWRAPNCTAYNYGYLWATHRLFYWQRDQAIVERRISDPCFGNINDPIELGFEDGGGEGLRAMRALLVRLLDNGLWTVPLTGWLSVPAQEPSPVVDIDSWRATERGDEGEMSFKLRVAAHRGARLLQAFLLLALLALLAVAAWLCRSCLVLYLQLAKSSTYAEPVSRPC